MKRQKVKGTGHKQPADANTEPNFYTMPPVLAPPPGDRERKDPPPQPSDREEQQHLMQQEEQVKPSLPNAASLPQQQPHPQPQTSPEQVALSPGIQSVHGAAHLLRGIATGRPYRGVVLPFVGLPPAAAPPPSNESDQNGGRATSCQSKNASNEEQRGASFLPNHEGI